MPVGTASKATSSALQPIGRTSRSSSPSPPAAIAGRGWQYLFVEGGAETAAAFLDAGLVDRLLLYRSPTCFGEGIAAFRDGFPAGWHLTDRRQLGSDTAEVYER